MSLYLKQIEQLVSLQKVDNEIHSITVELENAPRQLNELRIKMAGVEEERARQLDKMAHLHEQERRIAMEIEDDSARLKKSKGKLMTVENSKEYHAMSREMDTLERVNKTREEEKSALLEEVARQTALQTEIDERYNALKEELATCEATIQPRLDAGQADLAKLMLKRADTGKEVSAPVFARYEFIRARLAHPVIVPVSEGVCSGCNISIPPQNYIELQKAAQILSCPNCQRLMFWDRHFTPDKPEVQQTSEVQE